MVNPANNPVQCQLGNCTIESPVQKRLLVVHQAAIEVSQQIIRCQLIAAGKSLSNPVSPAAIMIKKDGR